MLNTRNCRAWLKGCWTSTATIAALLSAALPLRVAAADADFEDRVRAYLLANPEVILEALEILSERDARAAMSEKMRAYPELFAGPAILGIGPETAALRVVEFFDYRCAPCKVLHPKLEAALEAYPDVRVEMRHLPILSPGSERGARFALAVKEVATPEVYRSVHAAVWALKGPLRASAFQKIAEQHDLDWVQVETAMASDSVSTRIAENRDIAIDLEILGTPAFVTPHSVSFGGTDAEALVRDWVSQ